MVDDKKEKMAVLQELMKQMGSRVAEKDLKPKTMMVIKAKGDNPEELKKGIISKLQGLELPEMENEKPGDMMNDKESASEDIGEMENETCPECGKENCTECETEAPGDMENDMEGPDDFMSELPEGLRKALMNKMKK